MPDTPHRTPKPVKRSELRVGVVLSSNADKTLQRIHPTKVIRSSITEITTLNNLIQKETSILLIGFSQHPVSVTFKHLPQHPHQRLSKARRVKRSHLLLNFLYVLITLTTCCLQQHIVVHTLPQSHALRKNVGRYVSTDEQY